MRPSTLHVILLLLVIILLFGAKRLPDVARGIGQSLKVFKEEVKDINKDDSSDKPGEDAGPQNPAK